MLVKKVTCPKCEAVFDLLSPLFGAGDTTSISGWPTGSGEVAPFGTKIICPQCKQEFSIRDQINSTHKKSTLWLLSIFVLGAAGWILYLLYK